MLRKQKSKECSLRSSSSTEENQQGHQVEAPEEETLSSGRISKAVRSLDRQHCNRDYKVPFVQLLPSPRREELSLRSSLDSGLPVSYLKLANVVATDEKLYDNLKHNYTWISVT